MMAKQKKIEETPSSKDSPEDFLNGTYTEVARIA